MNRKSILKAVMERIKAVENADKSYKAFDGQDDNMDGKVKFVIETDGIEAEESWFFLDAGSCSVESVFSETASDGSGAVSFNIEMDPVGFEIKDQKYNRT